MLCAFAAFAAIGGDAVTPTNSLAIWYQQPARKWNEALPLGNSRLGAMVNGGTTNELISLNADTFWAGVPHDYSRPGMAQHLPEIRRLMLVGKENQACVL
jgi:alpha-L-fucosidase 2